MSELENLLIERTKITWEKTKERNFEKVLYKNQVTTNGVKVFVSKEMYVNGVFIRHDIAQIPVEVIDKVKSLEVPE